MMAVYVNKRLISPELFEKFVSMYGSRNKAKMMSMQATRQMIVAHSFPTSDVQKFTLLWHL